MTRFANFTNGELDAMESVFCNEGLRCLVDEIHVEKRYREEQLNIRLNAFTIYPERPVTKEEKEERKIKEFIEICKNDSLLATVVMDRMKAGMNN